MVLTLSSTMFWFQIKGLDIFNRCVKIMKKFYGTRKRSLLLNEASPSPRKKPFLPAANKSSCSILDMPESVIHKILYYNTSSDASRVGMACKQLNQFTLSFLASPLSIPVLFPSFTRSPLYQLKNNANFEIFHIAGSPKVNDDYYLDFKRASSDFRKLGSVIKKLSCLLPTSERMTICIQLMMRLSPSSQLYTSIKACSLCGTFFHQMFRGWTDEELTQAGNMIYDSFTSSGIMAAIMEAQYSLGSMPEMEMEARNFLLSLFVHEVPYGQEELWLRILLLRVTPSLEVVNISKLLLLLGSPVKEGIQFGVQWVDHSEAVPATYAVASGRYRALVSMLMSLGFGPYNYLTFPVLLKMFQTPVNWLPENVGSVLLLLGHQIASDYLLHSVSSVVIREDICSSCFQPITCGIIGMALMTARFRWELDPVYLRLEEVLSTLSVDQRGQFFEALWKGLTDEVTDMSLAPGEDWVEEGKMYLLKVIKWLGIRMTKKAFLPTTVYDSGMLSIEE